MTKEQLDRANELTSKINSVQAEINGHRRIQENISKAIAFFNDEETDEMRCMDVVFSRKSELDDKNYFSANQCEQVIDLGFYAAMNDANRNSNIEALNMLMEGYTTLIDRLEDQINHLKIEFEQI